MTINRRRERIEQQIAERKEWIGACERRLRDWDTPGHMKARIRETIKAHRVEISKLQGQLGREGE